MKTKYLGINRFKGLLVLFSLISTFSLWRRSLMTAIYGTINKYLICSSGFVQTPVFFVKKLFLLSLNSLQGEHLSIDGLNQQYHSLNSYQPLSERYPVLAGIVS